MSICYYCARRLSFWHIKCGICDSFSWRSSHILIFILGAMLLACLLLWLVY